MAGEGLSCPCHWHHASATNAAFAGISKGARLNCARAVCTELLAPVIESEPPVTTRRIAPGRNLQVVAAKGAGR